MTLKILCYAGLLSLPLTALAIDSGPSSAQQQETEGWLLLQISNRQASPTPQTATPTERELSMQRWLKSYNDEIPDFYDPDAGGEMQSK